MSDGQVPALLDAATKTGNQRVVRLDERTVHAIEALRRGRERYGPWMLQPGERPLNPERLTGWWRLEILPGDPLEYVEAMRRSHLLTA